MAIKFKVLLFHCRIQDASRETANFPLKFMRVNGWKLVLNIGIGLLLPFWSSRVCERLYSFIFVSNFLIAPRVSFFRGR